MSDNGLFICGTSEGILRAVHAETGDIVWEQRTPRSFVGAAGAYAQGRIMFLSLDGFLQAYDPTTGRIVWEKQLLPDAHLPLGNCGALTNETVVAFMYGKTIAMVHPTDGDLIWSYRTSGIQMSPLALSATHLYVAETLQPPARPISITEDEAARLESHRAVPPLVVTKALSVSNGMEVWHTSLIQTNLPPWDEGTPLIEDDGMVYVCGNGLNVLEAQSGKLIWKFEQPTRTRMAQLIKQHDAVVWIANSMVTAFNIINRNILWQEDLRENATTGLTFERFDRIVINEGLLFLGRSRFNPHNFWIEVRDPYTGVIESVFPSTDVVLDSEVAWRFRHTSKVFALPTATHVYAFEASLGKRLWTRDFGSELIFLLSVLG